MAKTLYLVTGAAGFLGSNVCSQLLERGDKVRAFVLEGDKSAKYIPKEVEIVYGDLCNKSSLFYVYNLKRNNQFDYSKAEMELGYKTRPIEETLHDEAKWLKDNGKI